MEREKVKLDDEGKGRFHIPWSDLIITLAIIRSWFFPSEVAALATLLTNATKTVASYLGIAAIEIADIAISIASGLRKVFLYFFCIEGFLLSLFACAIWSNSRFAGLVMLLMGVGVVIWLFAASWLVCPLGERGRAFTNMIQGLAYIPLMMFYAAAILSVLPRKFLTINSVVFSISFALLLATLTLITNNSGSKLLRGFMYALLMGCMLVGFSAKSPVVVGWMESFVATISGSIKVDTANQKGSTGQKNIEADFLNQLQPRILVCSQPLFDSSGALMTPKKVLGKNTSVLADVNTPMQIGAFSNAGVKIYDPQTYELLGVVPIRALSSTEKEAVAGGGQSQQVSFGGINKNILVPLLIIVFAGIGVCFKSTRNTALFFGAVGLVLWFWVGAKSPTSTKLTLQEEKGCEQLIVRGPKFQVGDFIIPRTVSGGIAYWADGHAVKAGTGRPALDAPPLRFCATDPSMVITYEVMKP